MTDDGQPILAILAAFLNKIPGLKDHTQIAKTRSPNDLARALASEDGSNFVFVSSDGEMSRAQSEDIKDQVPLVTNKYTFEGTREIVKQWHDQDPSKRHFMITTCSAEPNLKTDKVPDFNQPGILYEGLIDYAGDDLTKYLKLVKQVNGDQVKGFFTPIFNWLDSQLGVSYKAETQS